MADNFAIDMQAASAAPRRHERAHTRDAAQFSYALAAASLERQAAKSLEAHGARPSQAAATQAQKQDEATDAPAAERRTQSHPRAREPQTVGEPPRPIDAHGGSTTRQASVSVASGAASAASAGAVSPAQSFSPAAKGAELAAGRDASAKAKLSAPKAAPAPAEPAPLKEAFAEILARRLEKSSVFDLRLDPPEFGRVEGRLAVGDDGKAVLSLTFDTHKGFEHFSRDEQALRLALEQAGLRFDSGDFAFAFRAPTPSDDPAPTLIKAAPLPIAATDAAPLSPSWSAGALDIRI